MNSNSEPVAIADVLPHPSAGAAVALEEARALERSGYIAGVEAMLPAHLRKCGVGERHIGELMRGLDETQAVRQCRAWWESGLTFLLLTGGVGSGKTVAACELFKRLTRPGGYEFIGLVPEWDSRAGRLMNASTLARIGFWGPERDLLDEAIRRPLLVIDDLGTEFVTDAWRANLFEIIDLRWQRNRRTVITANVKPDELKAKYDPRIWDRIRDRGRAVFVGDKSLRGTAQNSEEQR